MADFLEKFMQKDKSWIIYEDINDKGKRKLYEALFTISNGYFGMRGINEDMPINTLPGTFIAGAFDKSECMCVEMVNFPNTVPLYFIIDDEKIDLDNADIIQHKRYLDIKNGAIVRETIFKKGEKETRFKSIRFISMNNRNSAFMICELTPLNWSGEIRIISELDGTVHNAFANYFPDEWIRHLWLISINDNYDSDTVMVVRTRDLDSKYCFATYLDIDNEASEVKRFKKIYGERIVEEIILDVNKGKSINLIKYIVVEDTKYVRENELVKTTTNILNQNKIADINDIWEDHKSIWDGKWDIADINVEKDKNQDELNTKIRFNLYHLLINGSENDYSHGIGIKGFTGEMYRGHYFWDTEMYMFPFYVYTNPKIARNLLIFRHKILDSARKNATSRGFKGALYSWEDDERGNEGINHEVIRETGELRIRETIDQYHKNLAIMYAVFNYFRATDDIEFMINYGADMLIENMRFWESHLVWNDKKHKYDSIKVMGPDEYHANINNNYYTNYLFKAIAQLTLTFLEESRLHNKNAFYKITKRLSVTEDEICVWKDLAEKIFLPEYKDGVLEQFEGYFQLKDYTFTKRNEFGIPVIEELDHLKNPSDPKFTPDLIAYHEELVRMAQSMRIIKQADTILIFNLFPFDFTQDIILNTLKFYEARTLHYSSLSPGVYALCAARVGEMELAKRYFELSLDMDLKDVKKESENALHTPTSGEIYTILTQGYGGVFPDGDMLVIKPHLPEDWKSLHFKLRWKRVLLSFVIEKKQVLVTAAGRKPIKIAVYNDQKVIKAGQTIRFDI